MKFNLHTAQITPLRQQYWCVFFLILFIEHIDMNINLAIKLAKFI